MFPNEFLHFHSSRLRRAPPLLAFIQTLRRLDKSRCSSSFKYVSDNFRAVSLNCELTWVFCQLHIANILGIVLAVALISPALRIRQTPGIDLAKFCVTHRYLLGTVNVKKCCFDGCGLGPTECCYQFPCRFLEHDREPASRQADGFEAVPAPVTEAVYEFQSTYPSAITLDVRASLIVF